MKLSRTMIFAATLALALSPVAAFAADDSPEHDAAELANGLAQLDQAEQQVTDLQAEANQAAANERMIALLKSQAMRERQLDLVANATAMEDVAASLANAARAEGDLNARNEVAIAQLRASTLVARADANVANALAIGRGDEIANAYAQSQQLHELADFLTGQLAEMNARNAEQIGEDRAEAIDAPALVEEENSVAMGAEELFGADLALQAGELNGLSAIVGEQAQAQQILAHAESSLQSDEVRAEGD